MKYMTAALFVASVVAANWATATFGLVSVIGLSFTAGTLAAGTALILRDSVQERLGVRAVLIAIGAGVLLSVVTSNPNIALASGLAFLASEITDFAVYTRLRHRNRPLAVILSSIAASPVDTFLFLGLAGFPITAQSVGGQFAVKTAMAFAVGLGLRWRSTSRVV